VTLRITTLRATGGQVVMVDGRLDARGVEDLERIVAELSGPFHLELAGLRSADETGLDALRALRARGIALTGVSHYFRLLLGAVDRHKVPEPPSSPRGRRRDRGARQPPRKP
jgi:hypothetical protein